MRRSFELGAKDSYGGLTSGLKVQERSIVELKQSDA